MKAISFNVNSIRTRLHQLEALIAKHKPDFIGLQETKVTDNDFPLEEIASLGYEVEYFGQKTHYGVAIMSRHPFKRVFKGFPSDTDDAQRRFIGGQFDTPIGEVILLNGYFPQGESRSHPVKFPNKEKFYADLQNFLNKEFSADQQIILMGDMNISHQDIDIGIGEVNRKRWLKTGKCSFLPEEREWLNRLLSWGLHDSFRNLNPDENNLFSWFDYRSAGFEDNPRRGLRIDLILATESLLKKCKDTGIDYEIRGMERPSDHCPVWAEFL
jgi:exodeoxyribonuclease III